MPGEVIDRPNPPAEPSQIPEAADQLLVQSQRRTLDQTICDALFKFRRAASYIAAAMIFLQDNVRLQRDLKPEDIKPSLDY